MPRRVRKGIWIEPSRVKAPHRESKWEKSYPKIISNNPRYSIKPGSAPDPKFQLLKNIIYVCFLFQDGLEFSSPKISAPFYSIDETCNPYAKDDKLFLETFQRHLNQPLSADSNADAATADESRSSAAATKFVTTSDCQLVVMLLIANSLLINVII